MTAVLTRKVGNSTTLTIPREFNVAVGKKYFAYQGVDGVIVYAPEVDNPFDRFPKNFIMDDEFEGVQAVGREIE